MSAYVVSDYHIACIVRNYAKRAPLDEHEQQVLANILLAGNIASVNYRYRENEPPIECDIKEWRDMDPAEVLSLVDCLDYNSHQRPDWPESLAKSHITRIEAFFETLQGSNMRNDSIWSI